MKRALIPTVRSVVIVAVATLFAGSCSGAGMTAPASTDVTGTTGTQAPPTTVPPVPICNTLADAPSRAMLLDPVSGFARLADTTGAGLDGELFVVTTPADRGPGSLRDGLEQGGRWVVFDKAVFPIDREVVIGVESPIMVGANTTLDGRCANVRLDGSSGTDGILFIGDFGFRGTSNVMVSTVKVGPVPGDGDEQSGDAIRVTWGSDRFFISHVELFAAEDEALDITRGDRGLMRGTVAHSLIRDTQKAVLVGDGTANNEKRGGWATNAHRIQVTFRDNWFLRNQIRNPLITDSTAHIYNNYVSAYGVPTSTEDGAGIEMGGNAWVWAESNVIEQASATGDYCGLEVADYGSLGVTGTTYLNTAGNVFRGIARLCESAGPGRPIPIAPPYAYTAELVAGDGAKLVARLTSDDANQRGRAGWIAYR